MPGRKTGQFSVLGVLIGRQSSAGEMLVDAVFMRFLVDPLQQNVNYK
jgi:hypothetical protein